MAAYTIEAPEGAAALAERVNKARTRGLAFVLEHAGHVLEHAGNDHVHVSAQGYWTLSVYYRLPWTLAVCGERRHAAAILSWAERHALTREGDLAPAVRPGYEELFASYPLANLAMGAWLLERYDTASRIMNTLASSFQDPTTGGAYSERPESRRTLRQDLFPTAQLGMSALMTGRRDVADAVARWFRMLWDAQRELPESLYTSWNRDGLVVAWPSQQIRGVDPAFFSVTRFQEPRQAFYNPGIAAAFLGRYAMATGDKEALALAREYLELSENAAEHQYNHAESKQVCKFAWGAAVVYEATGDDVARSCLERMATWFVESQEPDGRWHNSPFLGPWTLAGDLNITVEFLLHLTTVLGALCARGRGRVN